MEEKEQIALSELMSSDNAAEVLFSILSGQRKKGVVNKALVVNHDNPPTISIPKGMSKRDASEELHRQWKEEEFEIDVDRRFEGWKWQDVLVAVKITAEKYFGWINAQKSFMNPPTEIEIITDYRDGLPVKTTCFYGKFKVLALDEGICSIGISGGEVVISFTVKKKFKEQITQWYNIIDQHLRTQSIYRGKSVVVTSDGDDFGSDVSFEIIETKANPKIVLNPKERSVVEQYCRLDLEEEGKRTYLFLGPYGNGKTEAAMLIGDYAKALGMTFFYLKDSNAFIDTLSIAAKFYSPCFIFMEDIDEVGSGEERTQKINELLNTIDGAETKNKSIKILFTTNNHKAINPALRRPGRLDLIVEFNNPEKETAIEIYKKYFAGIEGEKNLDYKEISEKTPDCSGAFIAEICKRAVRLSKLNGGLTNLIVETAIHTISDHLKMMTEPIEKKNELENAFDVIATYMGKKMISPESLVNSLSSTIKSTERNLGNFIANESTGVKKVMKGAAKESEERDAMLADRVGNVQTITEKILSHF